MPSLGVAEGARWLDVGCGTGALSAAIITHGQPSELRGIDPSAGYAAFARARVADERATFEVADARELPFADGAFEAAVSGLVLNFVPEPERAAAEMARVIVPGGVAAAYVWDYAGEMQLLRRFWDAATALDANAASLDEGRRFPLCGRSALSRLFAGAGLVDVTVSAIDVDTVFRDFDDLWSPFLGGQGPAPGYLDSLSPSGREALRAALRDSLPPSPDGTIRLIARALTVSGRRRA